ncbi:MAG: MerR family transcriptional regulator [Flavobacteriaceae bacterium]|nr:MerR family transcriptional regulator [Flavobacteriaceae bacterium]|tara:strand:- start:1584 stop:1880 length:297 start_codon:yes stop_codon:yes gene_type:complete
MENTTHITVTHLCKQYEVTEELFTKFHDTGLIQITIQETQPCIAITSIHKVEKMIRLHKDLKVNPEGIDIILNLLDRIDNLSSEVSVLQQKLHIYSED